VRSAFIEAIVVGAVAAFRHSRLWSVCYSKQCNYFFHCHLFYNSLSNSCCWQCSQKV